LRKSEALSGQTDGRGATRNAPPPREGRVNIYPVIATHE